MVKFQIHELIPKSLRFSHDLESSLLLQDFGLLNEWVAFPNFCQSWALQNVTNT